MRMRFRLIVLLITASSALPAQSIDPVKIYQEQTGDGGFQYFAHNVDLAPYQLEITFSELDNLQPDVDLPYYTVIYPGDPKPLFKLQPVANGSTSFRSGYKLTLGDPDASINTDFIYSLPYEHQQAFTMVQGANGAFTHQGKHAWDFAMAEGTKVCASREGLVVRVKEDSNIGGADVSFMPHANRITILHDDGSYADYVHLQQHGSIVDIGDQVITGQVIAYSGNTGWSTKPHLHFQVYQAVKFGIQTLPAKFHTAIGVVPELKEQVSYRAVHKR